MLDYRTLKNLDKDDILRLIGLQSRPSAAESILPAIGLFGAGLLVGAGVALLFAPDSGNSIREGLKNRLQGNGKAMGSSDLLTNTGVPAVEKSRTL